MAKRGKTESPRAILLIHCPDDKGLVVAVTEFIYKNQGNITYLEQHVDSGQGIFFMRIEWELEGFAIAQDKIGEYFDTLVASRSNMNWSLHFSHKKSRMAVFVSKQSHCLYDILARYQSGEWNVEIPLIISNHEALRPLAEKFSIDYHHVPITKDTKSEAEQKQLELCEKYQIDFIVLARYMQILTGEFITHYPNSVINIHHSFLPAFPGARPYHRAYNRGVKIIGATSHYVTADLDAGPIIEQDVVRVSHANTVKDLIRKGKDLEKVVLSRAIWKHLQYKNLVYANRTVVFT